MESKVRGGHQLGWLKLEYSYKRAKSYLIANIIGIVYIFFSFPDVFLLLNWKADDLKHSLHGKEEWNISDFKVNA